MIQWWDAEVHFEPLWATVKSQESVSEKQGYILLARWVKLLIQTTSPIQTVLSIPLNHSFQPSILTIHSNHPIALPDRNNLTP